MKIKNVLILSVLIVVLSACSSSKRPDLPTQSSETNFTLLNGERVSLSSMRGKTVVVGFWTLWCKRSGNFLKSFDALAAKMKDRSDLVFLAVNLDVESKYEKVKERIASQLNGNLKHAFSGNAAADEAFILLYGSRTLPHILVIDPEGMITDIGGSISVVKDNI